MQSDFTKVNEKNLIRSLDCRLTVKDRLHDGFSSSLNCSSEFKYIYKHMYKKQVSRHTLTFTRRPLFLLEGNHFSMHSRFKNEFNRRGKYQNVAKYTWHTLLSTDYFLHKSVSVLLDLIMDLLDLFSTLKSKPSAVRTCYTIRSKAKVYKKPLSTLRFGHTAD